MAFDGSLFCHNSGGDREVFERFRAVLSPKPAETNFGNDSFHRRGRFRQIFVQIGAILAIFRPFEVFGSNCFENFERPFTPGGWLRSA